MASELFTNGINAGCCWCSLSDLNLRTYFNQAGNTNNGVKMARQICYYNMTVMQEKNNYFTSRYRNVFKD